MLPVRVDPDAVLDDARVAVSVGDEKVLRVVSHGDRGRLAVVRVVVPGLELEEDCPVLDLCSKGSIPCSIFVYRATLVVASLGLGYLNFYFPLSA